MALPNEEFPGQRQSPRNIQETPPSPTNQKDPLIAKGLQKVQYISIFALAIAAVVIVGFFSRRFEYALVFAVAFSILLIILVFAV